MVFFRMEKGELVLVAAGAAAAVDDGVLGFNANGVSILFWGVKD